LDGLILLFFVYFFSQLKSPSLLSASGVIIYNNAFKQNSKLLLSQFTNEGEIITVNDPEFPVPISLIINFGDDGLENIIDDNTESK
jgi:voltage-gated potassium channel Kch